MTIRNSLIIEKAKQLYLKHNGRNHRLIEKAMHDAGCLTFTRRVLYSRKYKNGQTRTGWIEKYGWRDLLSEPPAVAGGLTPSKGSALLRQDEQDRQDKKDKLTIRAETRPSGSVPFSPARAESLGIREEQPETSFPAWLKKVSSNLHWDWEYQKLIYSKLQAVTDGTCKRLMIFLPPRHGKSELVTVRYSAWRLRQDPNLNIILGSYNQRLANRFSRKVRITWEDSVNADRQTNEPIREHSCSFVAKESSSSPSPVSSSSQFNESPLTSVSAVKSFSRSRLNTVAEWETGLGGGVRAVGVGGGITGFGAGLVIIDDPVKSRAEAESKTYRDKVWEWFCDDLYTRLEPNASIILIQTRWHEDDLAGRLLKESTDGGEKWEVISLPALAEADPTGGNATVRERALSEEKVSLPSTSPSSLSNLPPRLSVSAVQPSGDQLGRHPGYTPNLNPLPEGEQPPVPPLQSRMFSNREEWIEYDRKLADYNRLLIKQDKQDRKDKKDELTARAETQAPLLPEEGWTPKADGVVGAAGGFKSSPPTPLLPEEGWPKAGVEGGGVAVPMSSIGTDGVVLSSDSLGRFPGEALCPERFSREDLLRIKRQLGSYSFSALYQQCPTPPEGGLFKRKWFSRIVDRAPQHLKWVRAYDLAVSTSTSADYTASFRCALDKQTGDLYIADGFRKRIEFPEQRRFIVQKILDEPGTEHGIEQALHGQAFIQDLRREHRLFGKAFRGIKVTADKFTRALSWANLAEEGKIVLVRGHWIEDFLDEVCTFPNSAHDDQIDAISLAVQMLEQRKFTAVSF